MRLNFGIYRAGCLIAKAENPEEAVMVAIVLGKGTSVKYAGRIVWKCLDSDLLQRIMKKEGWTMLRTGRTDQYSEQSDLQTAWQQQLQPLRHCLI